MGRDRRALIKFLFCFFILTITFCDNPSMQKAPSTYTKTDATIYFDSLKVDAFINSHPMNPGVSGRFHTFYKKRRYAAAWINREGVNEYAGNFINLLDNEPRTDTLSLKYREKLHRMYSALSPQRYGPLNDSSVAGLEFLLTLNFFDYAARNWGGASDSVLKKVEWFIERKKIDYEQVLASFLTRGPLLLHKEPVYTQYSLLKNYLKKYDAIEKQGGWPELPEQKIVLKKGDTSAIIPLIKKELLILEDLAIDDGNPIFDETLENAVNRFQLRHGLEGDGIVSDKTLAALRVPVHERIQQILINMERCRWVPAEIKGLYLAVNIPEFRLHVYRGNELLADYNVITGKSEPVYHTVIFNDSMEMLVFNPYWNIPKNILATEVLPEIKKNTGYLAAKNLEVVDNAGRPVDPGTIDWKQYTDKFPYIVRERPGVNNSLGQVKFLFPNHYDIYLHDTPAKSLFDEPSRAFSHGCIRVEEPLKLAAFLLKDDPAWTEEKIMKVLDTGNETFVKLKKKVPVFLTYFTAWVDDNGSLNFRDDVYGNDEKMINLLFVN
jgi:murein L,D-transpeptidase YcbB/YkuD